jgi:hypothetical protein
LDRFGFRRFLVAGKNAQFPTEDQIKGLFSRNFRGLGVHYLAFPKTYHALPVAASDMHAAGVPTDADQLNDVVKARVRDSAAESDRFQPSLVSYLDYLLFRKCQQDLTLVRFFWLEKTGFPAAEDPAPHVKPRDEGHNRLVSRESHRVSSRPPLI